MEARDTGSILPDEVSRRGVHSSRWGAVARRLSYSLAMSAGITSAIFAVLTGSVCKPTATFDFAGSLAAPVYLFTDAYFIGYPAWLVVALLVFPFARSTSWSKSGLLQLFLVPVGIYVVVGGFFAILLYLEPESGCF
ncbi:MAG: hypothetical protein JOZ58_19835 [Acetobacteraceae bacterium]|nr:hypothetical protein [Acetobacteraceae bacterium]